MKTCLNESLRRELTPTAYLRQMFEATADGKLTIEYDDFLDGAYTKTHEMDWSEADVDALIARFTALTDALTRIGQAEGTDTLSEEDRHVFDTYLAPFDPFEADTNVIRELYERRDCGDELSDEESDLLERHYEWFVENSLKRLPPCRCYPHHLINRAQRYEALIRLGAPSLVVNAEGCFLAEELAFYFFLAKNDPHNLRRFVDAQEDTYDTALEEIRNGRKHTHWMWFIFPQLRGLGQSDTARFYGIADREEASEYLRNLVLGSRLFRITEALLALDETDPVRIFGDIDAMKLQSSMTLFAQLIGMDSEFGDVLRKFFDGEKDTATLDLLNTHTN